VAVTTLASVALAPAIARRAPRGLCIAGKLETENIGIEKIVKNVVANPAIRVLICTGNEAPRHLAGATMLALFANGVDERRRIVGAPGARCVLPNATLGEIDAFRAGVEPIDMVGCTDLEEIARAVETSALRVPRTPRIAAGRLETPAPARIAASAPSAERIKLDRAGYFLINVEDRGMLVEHYDYRERLLRVVEGRDARSLYWTLISNGWVTQLDHAAYLGKELARAELCAATGAEFVTEDSARRRRGRRACPSPLDRCTAGRRPR
jgi:tetrahydromethanopterin S-methyltransferase subunit A